MQNLTYKFISATLLATFALVGCAASETPDEALDENSSDVVGANYVCSDTWTSTGNVPDSPTTGVVKATRAAGHPGFDRFVIEFTGGGVPGWVISRTDSATFWSDPSDEEEFKLAGQAGLRVAVYSSMYTNGWSSPEGGTPFTGPLRFKPNGTSLLTEAANLGDFEQVHTWGVGLKKAACYRSFKLENPPRLVIDVIAQ